MLNEKESKREKIRKKMCAEFAIIDNIYLKYSSCMRYQDARPISEKKMILGGKKTLNIVKFINYNEIDDVNAVELT